MISKRHFPRQLFCSVTKLIVMFLIIFVFGKLGILFERLFFITENSFPITVENFPYAVNKSYVLQ